MCISGIQCCPDETSCSRLWEEKCVRPFFAFWLPFKCSRHFFHDPTCCSLTVCDTAPFVQTVIMTNHALYVSHLSVLVAHPYIFMLRANPFLFSVTASWNNKKIIRPQRCQQIFISTYAKALFSAFAITDFGAPVFGVKTNNNTQPGIPGPLLVLYVLQHSRYTAVTHWIRQSLKSDFCCLFDLISCLWCSFCGSSGYPPGWFHFFSTRPHFLVHIEG